MRFAWSTRVLTSCAALLVCIGFLVTWGARFHKELAHFAPVSTNATSSENSNDGSGWKYSKPRDAENYGLSHAQCRAAFPLLFVEIDKSVLARGEKKISYEELNSRKLVDGMGRAIIYNGEVSLLISSSLKIDRKLIRLPCIICSSMLSNLKACSTLLRVQRRP